MQHWAFQYLGLPWTPEGQGPKEFNCWGLVRWVEQNHYQREVPFFEVLSPRDAGMVAHKFAREMESPKWIRIKKPVDGCLVALSHHKVIHHCGVYVEADGGMILHSMDGKGVLCQSIAAMQQNGWRRIEFYIHRSWSLQ